MSKDSYNIDSILSEVKKRREENEKEIKAKAEAEATEEVAEEPAEEIAQEVVEEPTEEPTEETVEEPIEEEVEETVLAEDVEETEQEAQPTEVVEAENEAPAEENDEEKLLAKKKKRRKALKGIIIALVVLIVGAVAFGAFYFNDLINDLLDNNKEQVQVEEQPWAGMDGNEENFTPIYETEATELASYYDMIKTWYYNGAPCSKSKVLNVLLLGEDTRGDDIKEEGTRADSAIICSINAETKTITLTSVLRDAYAYYETTPGDQSTGTFGKINGAMSKGDVHAYINAVENMYKIDIDNYVIVNFTSFKKIVDILGGVWIDITDKEINEINTNYKNRYGGVQIEKDFEGSHGEMKLTGRQALAYCRIRHIDSDNARADRQKTVLLQLFEQSKRASKTQLLKIAKQMIPYVATGFNKQEILKIAKYAVRENWFEFDTKMQSVPEANVWGGKAFPSKEWVWKCDFPQDAYNVQMSIYGKSSITLAHVRPIVKSCPETGFYNEGAPRMWQTMTNEHYGEVTTLPPAEEETEE